MKAGGAPSRRTGSSGQGGAEPARWSSRRLGVSASRRLGVSASRRLGVSASRRLGVSASRRWEVARRPSRGDSVVARFFSFRPGRAVSSSSFPVMSASVPPNDPGWGPAGQLADSWGVGLPGSPEVQASDPARLANGQVVPRQIVDMPTGGSFTVDLERAPQTLRDLTAARDELVDLMKEAQRLGKVDPGSADEVSRDAAVVLGAVADGGDGSLLVALNAGVRRLELLIAAIKDELLKYAGSEDQTRQAFDASRS
jgi:hypothetical protein